MGHSIRDRYMLVFHLPLFWNSHRLGIGLMNHRPGKLVMGLLLYILQLLVLTHASYITRPCGALGFYTMHGRSVWDRCLWMVSLELFMAYVDRHWRPDNTHEMDSSRSRSYPHPAASVQLSLHSLRRGIYPWYEVFSLASSCYLWCISRDGAS